MSERKLATIRIISDLQPIDGADRIELAKIDGWQVVVQKGLHNIGDKIVYCELDSWIPHVVCDLSKGQPPRVYEGIEGQRLKTIRLRGVLSQGLVLPLKSLGIKHPEQTEKDRQMFIPEGMDVSEQLKIIKWEKPIPATLAGTVKGNFPTHLFPKTSAERIQNIRQSEFDEYLEYWDFVCTEKLDGTSFSCYFDGSNFGVCSRNLELKETDDNLYWKIARKYNLEQILLRIFEYTCHESMNGFRLVIQGEIIGPNIQDNPYKLKDHELNIFSIFNINSKKYFPFDEVTRFCSEYEIPRVPLIQSELNQGESFTNIVPFIFRNNMKTKEQFLQFAEGKTRFDSSVEREGLVFFSHKHQTNFKVISNKFLLKNGD